MKCNFCGKESFFEMCKSCIEKHNPDRTNNIWKNNIKLADNLGYAYYELLLEEYDEKIIKKDSKENFGFNVFCDGIRLGLDTVMPLLNEEGLKSAEQKIKNMLKRRKESNEKDVDEDQGDVDELWGDGCFAETLGQEDIEEKMKTFHKKHDEDMNFNCKKCNKKISAHNKDWHNGLCDGCFNE